jgi:hypothetical protein
MIDLIDRIERLLEQRPSGLTWRYQIEALASGASKRSAPGGLPCS